MYIHQAWYHHNHRAVDNSQGYLNPLCFRELTVSASACVMQHCRISSPGLVPWSEYHMALKPDFVLQAETERPNVQSLQLPYCELFTLSFISSPFSQYLAWTVELELEVNTISLGILNCTPTYTEYSWATQKEGIYACAAKLPTNNKNIDNKVYFYCLRHITISKLIKTKH